MAKRRALNKKTASILYALQHMSKEQRQFVLRKADTGLIRCICECALNILNGNVTISKSQKQRLRKYAQNLRSLLNKKSSWSNRKKIIVQKGGFLSPLLTIVASILAGVIANGH